MSVIQRVVKAKTRKGKKVLVSREPQVVESVKRALILHGRKTTETVRTALKNIYDLRKPDALRLTRKHDFLPFEDCTPLEHLCKKNEAPLFVFGSNSKKRPDNVVFGRTFDYSLLDMIELGIDKFEPMSSFSNSKITIGTKPLLIFNSPMWEQSDELKQLKSLFIDFFHKEHTDNVRLQGLEHSISFTVTKEGKILIRSYRVVMKKSGTRVPRIELEEIGPRIDFTLRRSKLPSDDLMKEACRKPKELKVTKKKNISTDGLGTTHGRVHLGKQDINKLQTRKMKGLRKGKPEMSKKKLKQAADLSDVNKNSKIKRISIA